MPLTFYNSAKRRKEPFVPIDPHHVTVYVCGPTVYNLVHIGNGRPAVVFDVLVRYLRTRYDAVTYVTNVTDIDDKINAAAQASGQPISALADRYTAAYIEDVTALGVLPPDVMPRATDHIQEIVAMITDLIGKGHAYEADGHVLFHVPSDPEYGHLSNRTLEDMIDGARVEVAPYKRDPKDFVLWKPSTPELPGWDSPWGRGRPGWHIECSAMSRKHLGQQIDIHGGGQDLIFPHHENESAQSRSVHQTPAFANFWLHNGMLTLGQEKMSKSVGNIETIRDLLTRYSGELLRYALLSGQYRSQLAWTPDLLAQAKASLDRLYQALLDAPGEETAQDLAEADAYPQAVTGALDDDLNTPEALAALHRFASDIHKSEDAATRSRLRRELLAGGWLLGLLTEPPERYFQGAGSHSALSADEIEGRIAERNEARAAKRFADADAIRDALLAEGIELEDTRSGTRWKRL